MSDNLILAILFLRNLSYISQEVASVMRTFLCFLILRLLVDLVHIEKVYNLLIKVIDSVEKFVIRAVVLVSVEAVTALKTLDR